MYSRGYLVLMKIACHFIEQKIIQLFNTNWIMFLILLLLGSSICVFTKNEYSWDFSNYHYYNAFAFLNNRLNYDIVPASINTFLNPLIELPLYFIIEHFNDNLMIAYALQGVWFGLLIFTFFKIVSLFFDVKTITGIGCLVLTVALGITGQCIWFQAGSSTNEISIVFLSCWALYYLFKMIKYPEMQGMWKFLISGLILGSALGLKSTNIYVCVASGLSLILCFQYLKHPIKFVFYFALGGLIGFLITNGWWMLKLWDLYQNPVFPFLNEIFKSPYFDNFNYTDTRFIPPDYLKFIFPYIWLKGEYKSAEMAFYDIRGIVYYSVALVFGGYLFLKPKRVKVFYQTSPLWCFLSVFLVLSYILWLNVFSIYRYIGIIELFSAIFFVKLMIMCIPKGFLQKSVYVTICIIIVGILLLVPMNSTSWGHRLNDEQMVYLEPINLPENTLLKLYSFPTAGVIPILAKQFDFRALGYIHINAVLMKGSEFVERNEFRKIRDKIEQEHNGPEILISRIMYNLDNRPLIFDVMKKDLKGKYCRDLKNNLDSGLFICVPEELKDVILQPVSPEDDKCDNCGFKLPIID